MNGGVGKSTSDGDFVSMNPFRRESQGRSSCHEFDAGVFRYLLYPEEISNECLRSSVV